MKMKRVPNFPVNSFSVRAPLENFGAIYEHNASPKFSTTWLRQQTVLVLRQRTRLEGARGTRGAAGVAAAAREGPGAAGGARRAPARRRVLPGSALGTRTGPGKACV